MFLLAPFLFSSILALTTPLLPNTQLVDGVPKFIFEIYYADFPTDERIKRYLNEFVENRIPARNTVENSPGFRTTSSTNTPNFLASFLDVLLGLVKETSPIESESQSLAGQRMPFDPLFDVPRPKKQKNASPAQLITPQSITHDNTKSESFYSANEDFHTKSGSIASQSRQPKSHAPLSPISEQVQASPNPSHKESELNDDEPMMRFASSLVSDVMNTKTLSKPKVLKLKVHKDVQSNASIHTENGNSRVPSVSSSKAKAKSALVESDTSRADQDTQSILSFYTARDKSRGSSLSESNAKKVDVSESTGKKEKESNSVFRSVYDFMTGWTRKKDTPKSLVDEDTESSVSFKTANGKSVSSVSRSKAKKADELSRLDTSRVDQDTDSIASFYTANGNSRASSLSGTRASVSSKRVKGGDKSENGSEEKKKPKSFFSKFMTY